MSFGCGPSLLYIAFVLLFFLLGCGAEASPGPAAVDEGPALLVSNDQPLELARAVDGEDQSDLTIRLAEEAPPLSSIRASAFVPRPLAMLPRLSELALGPHPEVQLAALLASQSILVDMASHHPEQDEVDPVTLHRAAERYQTLALDQAVPEAIRQLASLCEDVLSRSILNESGS